MRLKESRVTDAAEMAAKILPVVASRLYDVPWVVRKLDCVFITVNTVDLCHNSLLWSSL